ncbi:virulence factor, partial [Massilia sp. Root335]|uniref:virulence factor n=1 Tax=Massilia sp. Root335 TaxID=1736517 RepID=UPI00138F39D3
MRSLTNTLVRRILWVTFAFIVAMFVSLWITWRTDPEATRPLSNSQIFTRLFAMPAAFAALVLGVATVLSVRSTRAETLQKPVVTAQKVEPFMAQVVGLQWLNPLQRRDYPTEWQLLWALGLVGPNKNDDMVLAKPEKYGKLQAVGSIAVGNDGSETFEGYHKKYLRELVVPYRDIYFMDSNYFYNAHSREDKTTWRELAGIHVEYALPEGKLDTISAANYTREIITKAFDIGNKSFPNSWTRSTPPDVHVTMGGANAGFTSLSAALDYLQAHPTETVWVMNWDAPSRPKDRQINENMVQLILAGPNYKTERAPLAWLGYPASAKVADFDGGKDKPPRAIQAWKAAVEKAAHNAGKQATDVGYVIHDANNNAATASDRIAALARTVTEE